MNWFISSTDMILVTGNSDIHACSSHILLKHCINTLEECLLHTHSFLFVCLRHFGLYSTSWTVLQSSWWEIKPIPNIWFLHPLLFFSTTPLQLINKCPMNPTLLEAPTRCRLFVVIWLTWNFTTRKGNVFCYLSCNKLFWEIFITVIKFLFYTTSTVLSFAEASRSSVWVLRINFM